MREKILFRNRDVLNLLSVLTAAVLSAVLLAYFFLYYYNPSGQYLAAYTLLDPSVIEQMNDRNPHSQNKKKIPFSFDHIEFSYFNQKNEYHRIEKISLKDYEIFFRKVENEKSLLDVQQNIQNDFSKMPTSLLTIQMKPEERNNNGAVQVFQVVQFVPEDYFRVQLHEKKEGEWAYFYQQGIYQETLKIFTSPKNL